MLKVDDGSVYSGKFALDGKEIDGELTFAGGETSLLLHHSEFFRPDNFDDQCLHGILRDLTRVSLFQCVSPQVPASHSSRYLGRYESAIIRPHFVLYGDHHITPGERRLKAIHFVLKDGPVIFPDYASFSTALNPTPEQLRSLLKEKQKVTKRRTRIGKYPVITYFTGVDQIFKAKTVLGTVSACHQPRYGFGGPGGVAINNHIRMTIAFNDFVRFEEALAALGCVLSFFEIIAGRRQEVAHLGIELKDKERSPVFLDVYQRYPPRRQPLVDGGNPLPIDIPIDAARQPNVFASVLTNWLNRHADWKEARSRFSSSFANENLYDPERLIGSANMFDLLPKSAVPQSVPLTEGLRAARDVSKKLFKALPESSERSSVLAALGRLGRASLKQKVRHRAEIVMKALGSELANLPEVLDLAIDARNHFVHGTESNIDYVGNFFETVAFFCKALEFVFVISDFLEAGWDVKAWQKRGTSLSHPLASFLYNYPLFLSSLREVLPVGHRLKAAG